MKIDQMNQLISNYKAEHLPFLLRDMFDASGTFIGYHELEMSNNHIDAHVDISYTKDIVSLHSHNFYELLYCYSGNLQYLIGNTRYQLQDCDIVIIPPGMSHRPLFLEQLKKPYKRIVIWLNNDFYKHCIDSLYRQKEDANCEEIVRLPYVIRPTKTIRNQMEPLFDSIAYECTSHRLGSELYIAGLFLQIFCILARSSYYQGSDIPKPEKSELLDHILQYIELHLSENLSLSSISAEFMVSQSTISQLFKKQMDTGFYKVVTQRRLIEAKNLINSGTSLKETALLCGFSDYSVFYKAFVKEYGISPREFRSYQ